MLYLLYGPDTFRSRQKLNEIIARAENLHKNELSFRKIDLAHERPDLIEQELETPSLFASLRFLVIENITLDKDRIYTLEKLIEKYNLAKNKESIIVFYEEELEEGSSFIQLVQKYGKIQKFIYLSNAGLTSWIINFFIKRKIKITHEAVKILVEGVSHDMWRLNNECEKLAAYAFAPRQIVTDKIINELMSFESEINIFRMVDLILNRNRTDAAKELELLLLRGEDTNGIFYLLVKQFQNLSQLFSLAQKGPLPANSAKILNIHPYIVNKMAVALKKWPEKELKDLFSHLAEFDLGIKTSALDARLVFSLLIAKI